MKMLFLLLLVLVVVVAVLTAWTGKHALGAIDALYLGIDPDLCHLNVHACCFLTERWSFERFREVWSSRFMAPNARLTQRPVRTWLSRPYWEPSPDFCLDDHLVHEVTVQTHAQLLAYVSASIARPLPQGRPPWRAVFLERYCTGPVILFVFHHCIADGGAMLDVCLRACDQDIPPPPPRQPRGRARVQRSLLTGAAAAATSAWKLLSLGQDPQSEYRDTAFIKTGDPKTVVWSEHPVPLHRFKAASGGGGATVNDVFVACVAGAFQRMGTQRRRLDHIHAVNWVNMRPPEQLGAGEVQWGNQLGAMYVQVPLDGSLSPQERLDHVHTQLTRIKQSPEAVVGSLLTQVFGALPPFIGLPLFNLLGFKVSLSTSNLRAPDYPLRLADNPVQALKFATSPSGNLNSFVALFSYNGGVCVAGCFRASTFGDRANRFIDLFMDELDSLMNN